jgi:hypothetical protein
MTSAITFAPTGGATNWAASGTPAMVTGGILLLAHIFVDAAMGSVAFSTAVGLLVSDRVIEPVDNPEYVSLCEQRKALAQEIKEFSATISIAEDYLATLADARAALEGEVHFAFRFNTACHAGAQQAEAGKATLQYLTA